MNRMPDLTGIAIAFGLTCAVVGWAVIEGLIWVISHGSAMIRAALL